MSARMTTLTWDKALDEFEPHVASFTRRGYDRNTALLALLLNRIYSELLDIEDALEETALPEDDDPDKPRWL